MHSEFDPEKAQEVVFYFMQQLTDISTHRISKLLYLADKTSLEQYGRLICGETYLATADGPAPKYISTWFRAAQNTDLYGFRLEGRFLLSHPKRAPILMKLSKSDITCLDQVFDLFGAVPMWWLTQVSKDEAYNRAMSRRGKVSPVIPIQDIIAQLEDADELLEHFKSYP